MFAGTRKISIKYGIGVLSQFLDTAVLPYSNGLTLTSIDNFPGPSKNFQGYCGLAHIQDL